jgi:SAM-dependent methyltransferase
MRYSEDYAELDYVCDITSVPVDAQSFDAALCTEVFEHVPDPVAALGEIARVLKPGGTFLCTFPLWNPVHYAPNHFYGGFSPYWIAKYFDENGFDVVTLDKLGGYFKYYGLNSQRFARRLAPQVILKSKWAQLLYWPVWAMIAGWFMVAVPFVCHFLDPLDKTMDWTLGYMIMAKKRDGTAHAGSSGQTGSKLPATPET